MKFFGTNVKSDLTVSRSKKTSNLELLCGKSDHELNTTVKDDFLRFLTVFCTPRYDKWFRS
jgi:hypothetical protein